MIKFEEHEGKLFHMLEEPTPLTPETEMPCLVRLIQDDSPMGKHNKDLPIFDPERLTPKICTEVVDVNDLSDPNRGRVRCDGFMSIQYYRYELIGTLVKEGSNEWALYQMMQGEKVYHPTLSVSSWIAAASSTGWEIYKEPKPLLADTGIGDIVKTNLGDWLQIVDTPCLRFGHDECYRTHDGLYWDEYGVCDVDSTYRLVAVEPLAPEGTAEWAWQMLKLQKPVSHPAEGELQDTDYTKEGFVRCMAKTGWQLYEPKPEPKLPKEQKIDSGKKKYTCLVCGKKMSELDGMAEVSIKRFSISSLYESTLSRYCGKCFLKLGFDETEKELRNRQQPQVDSEPQPAKETIANCKNCKHVCTDSNIDLCHMYEPHPESQYKVGDWVEHKESKEQATIRRIMSYGAIEIEFAYSTESDIYQANDFHNDFRKLSPSEVVIRIGCLSGTVDDLSYAVDGRFWLIGKATERSPVGMFALLYDEMLDPKTHELVKSLLKAQEEE